MQSRLGLQQTPNPPGAAPRVRATPKTAPKREGPLLGSVQVLTEHATSPGLQCLNCGAKFCGGATRIREHVTGLYCHEALHLKGKLQTASYTQAVEKWDTDSDSDSSDEEDLKM